MKIKIRSFLLQLVIIALIVGTLAGVLDLFIGHRLILDSLLAGDPSFISESYFAPTYFGLTKLIAVAVTFFFVYLSASRSKLKPVAKSLIVGILGTLLFSIYYYLTSPSLAITSSLLIAAVHFIFIFGVTYLVVKLLKFK